MRTHTVRYVGIQIQLAPTKTDWDKFAGTQLQAAPTRRTYKCTIPIVISTDMKSGSVISKLDLDVGVNYSVCNPWLSYLVYYYGNLECDYGDEVVGASDNSTRI